MNRLLIRALPLLLAATVFGQQYRYPGLWLHVSEETAPPGGVAQIKVTLTEPKPIIKTRLVLEFEDGIFEEVLGVAAFSEGGVAAGTAFRQGNRLIVNVVSPDATFGMGEDYYPILTVTARVRADAREGAKFGVRISPESNFWNKYGKLWEITSNEPGSVTVEGALSIDDVIPGGGIIPPGQEIRVLGRGFKPWSKVEVYEAPPLRVTYVSPNELTAVADEPYQLDQHQLRVINPDQTAKAYYPYVRGVRRSTSTYDLLAATDPIFHNQTYQLAVLDFPAVLAQPGHLAGVALLNPNLETVLVRFDLYDETGSAIATAQRELHSLERIARNIEELFDGLANPGHTALLIQSARPIHVLGLAAERIQESGAVLPLLPYTLP
jgi:hypothetical protein